MHQLRVLLRDSDIGDEWVKAQKEVTDLQEQAQTLTEIINESRKNHTAVTVERDNLVKELESFKLTAREVKSSFEEKLKEFEAFKLIAQEDKTKLLSYIVKVKELEDSKKNFTRTSFKGS